MAALAARQHGVVARRQLLALGAGRGAIWRRLEAGRLHPVHRGVYAVGHPRLIGRGRLMAAVLACGQDALLSHGSGALLWGIRAGGGAGIDVTSAARGLAGARHGVVLHRVRRLDGDVRAVVEGIPVTNLARTLLDLAQVSSAERVRRAFEDAERLRVLDVAALERLCDRARGRRGLGILRRLIDEQAAPIGDTRSELERAFVTLVREAGLPPPSLNVVVEGFVADVLWAKERLVVELDGYAFHRSRTAFERDRARDARLQLAGYRVIRITHRRLLSEAEAVIEEILGMLAAAQPPGAS